MTATPVPRPPKARTLGPQGSRLPPDGVHYIRLRVRSEPLSDGRPLAAAFIDAGDEVHCLGHLRSTEVDEWVQLLIDESNGEAVLVIDPDDVVLDVSGSIVIDRKTLLSQPDLSPQVSRLESRSGMMFSHMVRATLLSEEVREPDFPTSLTAYTDGSFYRRGFYGAGVVTESGGYACQAGAGATSSTDAEIEAIALALRCVPRETDLVLRLDSRDAIVLARRAIALHSQKGVADHNEVLRLSRDDLYQQTASLTRTVSAIGSLAALRTGSLSLEWVRGHAGEGINDLADRVARTAARGHMMGLVREDAESACRAVIGSAGLPPVSLAEMLASHLHTSRLAASLSVSEKIAQLRKDTQ